MRLVASFLLLYSAMSIAEETYRFERMWPVLQQPWYFSSARVVWATSDAIRIFDTDVARLLKVNPDGRIIHESARAGVADVLSDVASSEEILAVYDYAQGRIRVFSASLEPINTFDVVFPADQMIGVTGSSLQLDNDGTLYVGSSSEIRKYSVQGALLQVILVQDSGSSRYRVSEDGSRIYHSFSNGDFKVTISAYSASGEPLNVFTYDAASRYPGATMLLGEDGDGDLLICRDNQVVTLSQVGAILGSWSTETPFGQQLSVSIFLA